MLRDFCKRLLPLGAALLACTGDKTSPAEATAVDPNAHAVTCSTDGRLDPTYQGRAKLGTQNLFRFTLATAEPAQIARGTNSWTLQLTDPSGSPLDGAALSVTPFMPDHGHGTSVVPQVTATGNSYRIGELYFFMAGVWQITVQATVQGRSDTAVFTYCLDG